MVLQLPIGAEAEFQGVVDLVKMKAIVWGGEDLKAIDIVDIPADLQDKATEYREKLIELAVEQDEGLWKHLEGNEPSEEKLIECIRKGTIGLHLTQLCVVRHLKTKVFNLT